MTTESMSMHLNRASFDDARKLDAADICKQAAAIVSGDRARQHGDKERNFAHIASYWNVFIERKAGNRLTPSDVGKMMVLLKLARMESGVQNPDDALDLVGYGAIVGELEAA